MNKKFEGRLRRLERILEHKLSKNEEFYDEEIEVDTSNTVAEIREHLAAALELARTTKIQLENSGVPSRNISNWAKLYRSVATSLNIMDSL